MDLQHQQADCPLVFSILANRRASPLRQERSLTVDGRVLPVTVREHDRASRLTLRIAPGGQALRLTIPPHVNDRDVDAFLQRHRNWVATRIARLPDRIAAVDGAVIPFLGVDHRIAATGKLRGIVETGLEDNEPVLRVPGAPEALGRKLHAFMKKRAREELDTAVARHAAVLDGRPRAIRITDTTSRWGSCSTTRTLSFSWRIVMAPPPVLDYLAAHEVAHLREMNHSRAFWQLVERLCPDLDTHKHWLRKNGQKLHAIELT